MLAPTSASNRLIFRVDVALDNLRGDGRRPQSQFLAHIFLDPRRQMRAGAHRPGNFPDARHGARPFEPFQGAAKFIVHQRQLQPKRRRLRVDPVAAPDTGRELKFPGPFRDGFAERPNIGNQQVRRLHHLHGITRVPHVAAGEAKMEPARGVIPDLFGDRRGESDDIVVECFFQFPLAFDQSFQIGKTFFRAGFDFGEIIGRNDAFLDERLAGEQLDLQPDAEFILVLPDRPHFGPGIARNHASIKTKKRRMLKRERAA